jgi:diguanylate cyclase
MRSCAASPRLKGGVRDGDLVARLGGDEFAVLLAGLDAIHAAPIARDLVARVSKPYSIQGREIRVSASVGLAEYPRDGRDAASVVDAADTAMYRAKHGGKGRVARSGHPPD